MERYFSKVLGSYYWMRVYCDQLAECEVGDVREGKTVGKDAALLSLNAGICTQESPVAVGPSGDSVKKKRVRDVSDKCTTISNALLRSSWHFYVTHCGGWRIPSNLTCQKHKLL